MRCGVSISEYEDLTPRQLTIIMEEHNEIRQRQREDMLTQAYYTARWPQVKRMPSLKQVLESSRPKKRQTDEQMFDMVKHLQDQLAGEEG